MRLISKPALKRLLIAAGLCLGAILAFACYLWVMLPNPHRDLKLLAKPERYEPVFTAGIALLEEMRQNPKDNFVFNTDPRVGAIKRAFLPVNFQAVVCFDETWLEIYAGGGFGHYGYILTKDATGAYRLELFAEDMPEETKILKQVTPANTPALKPSARAEQIEPKP
jgi:hypothetical protein